MPILNTIFERPNSDDLVKSLGNMIVSGVENEGNRKLYYNILSTLIAANKTVVLFNGALSVEQYNGLERMIRSHMIGRRAYNLSYLTVANKIDILSAFDNADEKAEFVVTLLSSASELPEIIRNKAQRFYLYAISTLDALGKSYKLSDLTTMDVDYVYDLVKSSTMPELEKNRRIRFLTDSSMYSSYLDIETCMVKLESYKLVEFFSGDEKVADMFSNGNVVMLNGFISDEFKKKELLFNTLFYVFSKCLEKKHSMSQINFLLKDSDFISGDYVKTVLEYNQSYHYSTYIFVDDVARYISKNGNELLDLVKSAVVFTQGSDENANFWSTYFGNRDVNERSYSYTKKKSWNPFSSMTDSGGVVSTPRKYNSTTTSFQKVNKPIYRPEVFRELRSNEAMCYLREPLMRRKTRIEG